MSNLTQSDKISFAETVEEIMTNSQEELQKVGFPAKERAPKQKENNENYIKEDGIQEKMKAQMTHQTKITTEALNDTYEMASNNVDGMVGLLGKDSELSKRLKKLREAKHHSNKK
jgi:hypothetical protein